jgi:hypothetical protein
MALLGGSILDVVTYILEGAPDPGINPRIYQEIVKIQNAVKLLAAEADAYMAAVSTPPGYEIVGNLNSGMYLQNLMTVNLPALSSYYYSCPVRIVNSGGVLKASNTAGYGVAEGYIGSAITAGTTYPVVLKGLVALTSFGTPNGYTNDLTFWYYRFGYDATNFVFEMTTWMDTSHYRLATSYYPGGGGNTWFNALVHGGGQPTYQATFNIGTMIGSVGSNVTTYSLSGSQPINTGSVLLLYFNPRQV